MKKEEKDLLFARTEGLTEAEHLQRLQFLASEQNRLAFVEELEKLLGLMTEMSKQSQGESEIGDG